MKWRDVLIQDMRLAILLILKEAPGYELSSPMLVAVLEQYGHHVSHDTLATQLAWMSEQGLVNINDTCGMSVATITGAGMDVSTGRSQNPGVKRPAPGA